MKKVRSSQAANLVLNWVKHSFSMRGLLREKIISLREVLSKAPTDVLCVDETKLNTNFLDRQLKIPGYQFPLLRRDRNCKGRGK